MKLKLQNTNPYFKNWSNNQGFASQNKNTEDPAVANLNSNRAEVQRQSKRSKLTTSLPSRDKSKEKIKLKVVKVHVTDDKRVVECKKRPTRSEVVQFEEEGEIIEMEIDDGGEAERQFAMEEDNENNETHQDEQLNPNLSDSEESLAESGEISPTQTDELIDDQQSDDRIDTNAK